MWDAGRDGGDAFAVVAEQTGARRSAILRDDFQGHAGDEVAVDGGAVGVRADGAVGHKGSFQHTRV